MNKYGSKRRRGISLMEVLISLAIFVAAVAVLLKIANQAEQFGGRAAQRSEAQTYCNNLLQEIATGIRAFEAAERQPIDPELENSPWTYSLSFSDLPEMPGLRRISVQVYFEPARLRADSQQNDSDDVELKPLSQLTLLMDIPQSESQTVSESESAELPPSDSASVPGGDADE